MISVIIPFYKEISLIGRAVSSVVNQVRLDKTIQFEILIGNDGDCSNEEVQKAAGETGDLPISVIKNTATKGPGGARNCALNEAKGELIAFLDADDYWLPEKTSEQLQLIARGCNFVSTAYRLETSGAVVVPPQELRNPYDLLRNLGIGTSTVLMKRSLCEGKRFRDMRFAQDIDFWYLLSRDSTFHFGSVSTPLVVYAQGGSSSNKFEQLAYFWRVLQLNQIGCYNQVQILLSYVVRGLLTHYLKKERRKDGFGKS